MRDSLKSNPSINDKPCKKYMTFDEIEECIDEIYKELEQMEEEMEKEKFSNIPACYRCTYERECPVYWHFGNAACITIYRNKYTQ